jgi:hypothetical protein
MATKAKCDIFYSVASKIYKKGLWGKWSFEVKGRPLKDSSRNFMGVQQSWNDEISNCTESDESRGYFGNTRRGTSAVGSRYQRIGAEQLTERT